MESDIFFSTVASLVIPLLVAAAMSVLEKAGIVWAKLNQPTIAAVIGGVLGVVYHIEQVHFWLNNHPPEGTVASFIVGGIMAGLAGSGITSLAKDVRSGAITTGTKEGVMRMRRDNSSGDGIGGS